MSTSPDLDPRARFWGRIAAGAAILGVGFVVAPFVWTALGGLLGLCAAGGVLVATWMVLPAITAKAANWRLKLIKLEAATNPVESLQAEHNRQSEMLEERRKGIETMAGAVRTLWETIRKLAAEFPDSPELEQLKADHAELKALEDSRRADWQDAYVTLGEFAKEIKRASRLWDVSVAAAKARGLSGLSNDEWMAKLRTETSFEAIRTKLNTELSALSTERMQADAERLLKGKVAARTINVTPAKPALAAPSSIAIDATVLASTKAHSRSS